MGPTNIDIDETACEIVMRRHQLATKQDAVNFSLRTVAGEAMTLDEARALRGSGWGGDLDMMRSTRVGRS
jgi:Arc/MetJ family transcription regulator